MPFPQGSSCTLIRQVDCCFHCAPFSTIRSPVTEVLVVAIYSSGSTPPESFSPRFGATPTYPPPVRPSSSPSPQKIALEIASHVTTLLSLPTSSSAPTYLPLKLADLNSVATAQLYFWLQERCEYDGDFTRLYLILQLPPSGNPASPAHTRFSSPSTASSEAVNFSYSQVDFQPIRKYFDEIDLETGVFKKTHDTRDKPEVYTIDSDPLSYTFVSWMICLMWNGSKKPLTKDDLNNLYPIGSSSYVDRWVSQFWDEHNSFCKQSTKDLPRFWGFEPASSCKSPLPLICHD